MVRLGSRWIYVDGGSGILRVWVREARRETDPNAASRAEFGARLRFVGYVIAGSGKKRVYLLWLDPLKTEDNP